MLPEERRQKIIEIIQKEGKATVTGLAEHLSISVDTVRRDLKELEITHQLTRVHGGAMARLTPHIPYVVRKEQNQIEKQALAIQAAKLIQSNKVIFIDGGSTTLEVAKNIPLHIEATVITNCPFVLVALSQHQNIKAIILGGTLNRSSMTVVGSTASTSINNMFADMLILGICSLHPEIGITAHDYDEAQIKRQMIKNASQVVAVTSSEKLGKVAPFVVAELDALTHLVTDISITDEQLEIYKKHDIQVIKS